MDPFWHTIVPDFRVVRIELDRGELGLAHVGLVAFAELVQNPIAKLFKRACAAAASGCEDVLLCFLTIASPAKGDAILSRGSAPELPPMGCRLVEMDVDGVSKKKAWVFACCCQQAIQEIRKGSGRIRWCGRAAPVYSPVAACCGKRRCANSCRVVRVSLLALKPKARSRA